MNIGRKYYGFTIFEILVFLAILATILAAIISIADVQKDSERKVVCMNTMSGVTTLLTAWTKTVTPDEPNGEINLCRIAKSAVDSWNGECSDVLVTLPGPEACS